jgi:guanylate kinase
LTWNNSLLKNNTTIKLSKIVIITAPSGSGKTTIVKRLLESYPKLAFSISACTRNPRPGEQHGKDYYFLQEQDFLQKIKDDAFIEWEMVYTGKYYGTLKTELQRIWDEGNYPLVDIDVQGALNIKQKYPSNSISLFIKAPSMEELKRRLINRGTENEQTLKERLNKASEELTFAPQFDKIVVNEKLEVAVEEIKNIIESFIGS